MLPITIAHHSNRSAGSHKSLYGAGRTRPLTTSTPSIASGLYWLANSLSTRSARRSSGRGTPTGVGSHASRGPRPVYARRSHGALSSPHRVTSSPNYAGLTTTPPAAADLDARIRAPQHAPSTRSEPVAMPAGLTTPPVDFNDPRAPPRYSATPGKITPTAQQPIQAPQTPMPWSARCIQPTYCTSGLRHAGTRPHAGGGRAEQVGLELASRVGSGVR
jgi:hypothetical protein